MDKSVRKVVVYDEETHIEGFKRAEPPHRLFAVAAVVTNPWAGRFVEDLKPGIQALGPSLGEMLTKRIVTLAGGGAKTRSRRVQRTRSVDVRCPHVPAI